MKKKEHEYQILEGHCQEYIQIHCSHLLRDAGNNKTNWNETNAQF